VENYCSLYPDAVTCALVRRGFTWWGREAIQRRLRRKAMLAVHKKWDARPKLIFASCFREWRKVGRKDRLRSIRIHAAANWRFKMHGLSLLTDVISHWQAFIVDTAYEEKRRIARERHERTVLARMRTVLEETAALEERASTLAEELAQVQAVHEVAKHEYDRQELMSRHDTRMRELQERVVRATSAVREGALPPARFVVYPPRTGAKEETFTHEAVEVAIGPENSVSLRSPRKREWQFTPAGEARLVHTALAGTR